MGLGVVFNKLKISFRISKEPEFVASEEKLWEWNKKMTALKEGFNELPWNCREDLSKAEMHRIILNHQGTDEELYGKLCENSNIPPVYTQEEKIGLIKAALEQGEPLTSTIATFEDKNVTSMLAKHNDLFSQGYFHNHHRGFFEGLTELLDICDLERNFMPKNCAMQLTKFMATNQAFQAFLKEREKCDQSEETGISIGSRTIAYSLISIIFDLSARERDIVLNTIADNPVLDRLLSKARGLYSLYLRDALTPKTIDAAVKDKEAMLTSMTAYPTFKSVLTSNKSPDQFTMFLARGLSPTKFEQLLYNTNFFVGCAAEGVTIDDVSLPLNAIAVEALMYNEPGAYKATEKKTEDYLYPPIEKVCKDPDKCEYYTSHAKTIFRIAFAHCNNNDNTLKKNRHESKNHS